MIRKMMQALISAERKITMAEENKKPDYTDLDWSWLIRDREEKWAALLQEADEKGWKKIPLRQTEKFTSQLNIVHLVHSPQLVGAVIIEACAVYPAVGKV